MTELVRYEAACRALAEAVAADEVMTVRDQAEAMRLAAKVAKNLDLEIQAAQIRFRAERRLGELVAEQKATVGLAKGGRPYQSRSTCSDEEQVTERPATLAEAGIDRKLSSKAQRLAAMDAADFEAALGRHAQEMRAGAGRVAMDLTKVAAEEKGREHRRGLAQALSDASALQPTGRKYPIIYADPPWHRNQGVTSRSYENHYPTMPWSEICELPVKDMVLPDAWLFLWIPRAHLLAWHEAEIEATDLRTGEVIKVRAQMPLASTVALAWGFEAYSTAFVWTKNDDDHPDEAGGAVLVRDQDELLLLFKRGKGLPKPASGEKFGSNHRERSRPLGHSRKPDHYRRMIAAMGGGVPVLELFARVDAENPLPAGWSAWGNQAAPASQLADAGAHAGDPPARSAGVASLPIGEVVSGVAAAVGRADTAEPPANRPGVNSNDDGLDIPAFLRRQPVTAEISGQRTGQPRLEPRV
ncbi:N6-adenosine-specific RNA methylase IME4 [Bradyrhizobium elkanii]